MKTAVSVPDDLFRLAEAAARRLRVSRSQLYATAISEFLNRQQSNAVTERLNEVYSRQPAKVDAALHRAQLKSLEGDSWWRGTRFREARSGGPISRSRVAPSLDTGGPCLWFKQTPSIAAAFKPQSWPSSPATWNLPMSQAMSSCRRTRPACPAIRS